MAKKKTTAAPAPKKPSNTPPKKPAKAAPKPKGRPPGKVKANALGLKPDEIAALKVLAKSKTPMTRTELAMATGIEKGWSKRLGTVTKDNGGNGLEGLGLVKSEKPLEGDRAFLYTITPKGRQRLDALTKKAA